MTKTHGVDREQRRPKWKPVPPAVTVFLLHRLGAAARLAKTWDDVADERRSIGAGKQVNIAFSCNDAERWTQYEFEGLDRPQDIRENLKEAVPP